MGVQFILLVIFCRRIHSQFEMSYEMAVESVRECSGFTEEQCRRLLHAAGDNLEDALAMLYEEDNSVVTAIRAEKLPPTFVPEYIPAPVDVSAGGDAPKA